jgi:hypothetical protein
MSNLTIEELDTAYTAACDAAYAAADNAYAAAYAAAHTAADTAARAAYYDALNNKEGV